MPWDAVTSKECCKDSSGVPAVAWGFGVSLASSPEQSTPLYPTEPAVGQGNLTGGKRCSRQIPQDVGWLHPDRYSRWRGGERASPVLIFQ